MIDLSSNTRISKKNLSAAKKAILYTGLGFEGTLALFRAKFEDDNVVRRAIGPSPNCVQKIAWEFMLEREHYHKYLGQLVTRQFLNPGRSPIRFEHSIPDYVKIDI